MIMHRSEQSLAIRALRSAAPYVRLYKGKTFVVKVGGGVQRVHVVSYQSPEGILGEVFTNEGTGTLIVPDVHALSPAEQQGVA